MTSFFLSLVERLKPENVIDFLCENELLPQSKPCACGAKMQIQEFSRSIDKKIFRCNRCKRVKGLRENTFFDKSRLSLSTITQLMFFWFTEMPITTAAVLGDVSKPTAIEWYNNFRDVCSAKMLAIDQQLGGINRIVEIDESLMFRTKYHVGRAREQFWIFAMYDLGLKRGYAVHVENRSAEVLLPIIQRWVAPGSTIHSDQWAAYRTLSSLGYHHVAINHREIFVDPESGATTNHVEAFWSRIKRRLKYISASQGNLRWAHLDEACYRHWFGFKNNTVKKDFFVYLSHIASLSFTRDTDESAQ
jgi:IS1 family transposase